MTVTEIARKLGVSPQAVEQTCSRALAKLAPLEAVQRACANYLESP